MFIPIALQITALAYGGIGVFGQILFPATAELQGCNECRKCIRPRMASIRAAGAVAEEDFSAALSLRLVVA